MISSPLLLSKNALEKFASDLDLTVDFGTASQIDRAETWWRWLLFRAKHPQCWQDEAFDQAAWQELNQQIDAYCDAVLGVLAAPEASDPSEGAQSGNLPYWTAELPAWVDDLALDDWITARLRAKGEVSS